MAETVFLRGHELTRRHRLQTRHFARFLHELERSFEEADLFGRYELAPGEEPDGGLVDFVRSAVEQHPEREVVITVTARKRGEDTSA